MKIKCPLCQNQAESGNSPHFQVLSHQNRVGCRFQHCSQCDLIFLEPEFYVTAEAERHRYDQHQNTKDNLGYIKQFDEIRKYLKVNLKKPATVLDFGCGPGPVLAELLRNDGYEAEIYDPYFFPDQQALLKKYQAITCTEAIEHFYEPGRELEKLVPLLETGGFLLIQTHFMQDKENFSKWWYGKDPTHVCFFSEKSFRWMADKFHLRAELALNPLVIFKKL